ncbi:MAG: aldehyde ferredoxin oxidoreductase family protein [Candidatus Methanofastidiosia archaeon]
MKGWKGSILRINLTNKETITESVDKDILRKTIGGVGLATQFLYNELLHETDPLSAENKIMISTGPFTGTCMVSTGRFCIVTKSPLTNCFLQSHSGGQFGPELKYAGYDGIIIEGLADEPTYVFIDDDYCEFKSATKLWGKGVKASTRALEQETDSEAKALVIGPAGENRVLLASVQNDVYRACGRGGAGAVFGSKNLKAVVVRGSQPVEVHDPEDMEKHIFAAKEQTREKVGYMIDYGTTNAGILTDKASVLPTKNFSKGKFEGIKNISGEALKKEVWKGRRACFACPIGCSQFSAIDGIRTEGPEYETIFSLGSNVCNDDPKILVHANEMCNELGLDTMSVGVVLSWAMEAYEKEIIDEKIGWGDGEAMLDFIYKIAHKEGIGKILSQGTRRASDKLGGSEFAINVKGLELAGYEPRGSQGMALAYATSTRGACHLRSVMYLDEVFSNKLPGATLKGKVKPNIEYENILTLVDSLIMCRFASRSLVDQSYEYISKLLYMVTGEEFTPSSLEWSSIRTWNMQRLFNIRQGVMASEDTLPERFFSEKLYGAIVDRDKFNTAIRKYYSLRGWDEQGVPTKTTMKKYSI